jgi:sulfur carrier protein
MTLTVNGVAEELAEGFTVGDLVRARTDERKVAVARNGEVVPRGAWDSTVLEPGDAVEILIAVAGG